MNWLIVGQGAMGLLWYHHLSQVQKAKARVKTSIKVKSKTEDKTSPLNKLSLLASKQQKLTQNNYQFTALNKQTYSGIVNYAQTEQLQAADTVFLCVKSYQINHAITQIAGRLKANCNIILAHNGMGTLEKLPQAFIDKHTIYALLTTHGCLRNAPLDITHTGSGESSIGLVSGQKSGQKSGQQPRQESGQKDSVRDALLTNTLNKALPSVKFEANIAEKQWLKLAINCVINPITALNNIDNGLVNNTQFTKQIQALLIEIIAVAKTQGIVLAKEALEISVRQVAQATAKNCSSMRCDVLANRQTEIDYINGYIHHLGQRNALTTPENTKLWQEIKKLNGET